MNMPLIIMFGTPPLFSLKCLYDSGKVSGHVSLLPLSVIFLLDLGMVPTVLYVLLFILFYFIIPMIYVVA